MSSSDVYEAAYRAACARLRAIPGMGSGPMGLTPDAIKFSPAYREAKAAVDATFALLRRHNLAEVKRKRQRGK